MNFTHFYSPCYPQHNVNTIEYTVKMCTLHWHGIGSLQEDTYGQHSLNCAKTVSRQDFDPPPYEPTASWKDIGTLSVAVSFTGELQHMYS